jgi:carboxymethylenebutenolidase
MAQWLTLDTADGPIRAWRADPAVPARGAIVVVQEIFGVNAHIRAVCARFAAHGFIAMAPALFDHAAHDAQLDYTPEGTERGRALAAAVGFERALADVQAGARLLDAEAHVGVVGYCWGGTVALLANTRLGLPAVSYYGARSQPYLHEALAAPMLFHFGERDGLIPPEVVQAHRAAWPEAELHCYPAGHGFNCEQRADFDAASAALALERTLAFFARHLHRPPDSA